MLSLPKLSPFTMTSHAFGALAMSLKQTMNFHNVNPIA